MILDSDDGRDAASDREALVAFYNATDGDNWTNNTNWLGENAIGTWHGVTTNSDGRVTELKLDLNGLSGSIPASLGTLGRLRKLVLELNQLSGSIPSELGDLANLRTLDLDNNLLSGALPPELGDLRDWRC